MVIPQRGEAATNLFDLHGKVCVVAGGSRGAWP